MERNAYIDNARILLILLVVFGHMIQPFIGDSHGVNTLYMWIYTFHMPAFIFLAGFFAKGFGNMKYVLKLAKKLLIPYMIFQLIYTGFFFLIGKESWQASIFDPHWSLWFLFSLFSWHILLYWFKQLPPLLGITIAVEIGLIVGYFGEIGNMFSLSRTFVFFPFFLVGYWVTNKHLAWLKHNVVKVGSVLVMLGVAVLIYFAPEMNSGWLLASKSYVSLGMPTYGGIARFAVYVTSALMAISALSWVPTKRFKLTYLGSRTLFVYLLHGFFIQSFRQAGLFSVNNTLDLVGLFALSALIVLVLSSKPILGLSRPVIELKTFRWKEIFSFRNKSSHPS